MSDLNSTLENMKLKYREIFQKSSEAISQRIETLRPEGYKGDFLQNENWKKSVLDMFENDIAPEIYRKWQEIIKYREKFQCNGCATCCNLACSEYSYEELKKRASKGDNFAKQFTKIFIPYESKEDAKKVYPQYIELLDNNTKGNVYFYHCPKLNDCKRCSDYENRPDICRHFPDNPLDILPESCGFYEWRREVEPVTLMLHAMVEIIDYYKEKIK